MANIQERSKKRDKLKNSRSMELWKDMKSSQNHNPIVGHHGVDRTLKAMSLGGHAWARMRQNVSEWIYCSIQVSTASGAGGQSGASSIFSISIEIVICGYTGSSERR